MAGAEYLVYIVFLVLAIFSILIVRLEIIKPFDFTTELQQEIIDNITLQSNFDAPVNDGSCSYYYGYSTTDADVLSSLTGKDVPIADCDEPYSFLRIKQKRKCNSDRCVGLDGREYTQGEEETIYSVCGTRNPCLGNIGIQHFDRAKAIEQTGSEAEFDVIIDRDYYTLRKSGDKIKKVKTSEQIDPRIDFNLLMHKVPLPVLVSFIDLIPPVIAETQGFVTGIILRPIGEDKMMDIEYNLIDITADPPVIEIGSGIIDVFLGMRTGRNEWPGSFAQRPENDYYDFDEVYDSIPGGQVIYNTGDFYRPQDYSEPGLFGAVANFVPLA